MFIFSFSTHARLQGLTMCNTLDGTFLLEAGRFHFLHKLYVVVGESLFVCYRSTVRCVIYDVVCRGGSSQKNSGGGHCPISVFAESIFISCLKPKKILTPYRPTFSS